MIASQMIARVRRFRTTVSMAERIVSTDKVMDSKAGRVGLDALVGAEIPDDAKNYTLTVEEIEDAG